MPSPNPLDEYIDTKTAAKAGAKDARKQKDLDMLNHWRDNGQKPVHLQPLLKAYEPIIESKIRAWKPKFVPEASFRAELQQHAIKAFQDYDPSKGAALNTHVQNRLARGLRYGNRAANMAYIPEGQSALIGPIDRAKDVLTDSLGREPTNKEIHQHLLQDTRRDFSKVTLRNIETVQERRYSDIPASRSAGPDGGYDESATNGGLHPKSFEEGQLAIAANILPTLFPRNQLAQDVFHHIFGTNGFTQISSTQDIASELGKSVSQVARARTQLDKALGPYASQSPRMVKSKKTR